MGDPSLVSSRKNIMAKVKEQKSHKNEGEGKVLFRVVKPEADPSREEGDICLRGKGREGKGRSTRD